MPAQRAVCSPPDDPNRKKSGGGGGRVPAPSAVCSPPSDPIFLSGSSLGIRRTGSPYSLTLGTAGAPPEGGEGPPAITPELPESRRNGQRIGALPTGGGGPPKSHTSTTSSRRTQDTMGALPEGRDGATHTTQESRKNQDVRINQESRIGGDSRVPVDLDRCSLVNDPKFSHLKVDHSRSVRPPAPPPPGGGRGRCAKGRQMSPSVALPTSTSTTAAKSADGDRPDGQRAAEGPNFGAQSAAEPPRSKKKWALDLFCGQKNVSNRLTELGYDVISIDMDPKTHPSICVDVMNWRYNRKYPPKFFDVIAASVPCEAYSRARTTRERDMHQADLLVQRTLRIIRYFCPEIWWIENPRFGELRNRPFMN